MYDPTAAYRTAQVATTNPVGQVVLLYEGAIRFASQHLAHLERGDIEAAHHASIRAQAVVAGLQEVLDLSAGPVAAQLDSLYDFTIRRLIAGNLAKDPAPTQEAITVLRDLLDAWREIARGAAPAGIAATPSLANAAAPASTVPSAPGAPFAARPSLATMPAGLRGAA